MIQAPERRLNVSELLSTPLGWEVDPQHFLWLQARFGDQWLHLRINARFPDVPAYSLLIGPGEFFHFDDLPARWKRIGRLEWPAGAERAEPDEDDF